LHISIIYIPLFLSKNTWHTDSLVALIL
jgi:hypothetical protein